ncbi:two-component system histidine kinase PnpS [Paenibacillus mucilaginosus]|uniref:histidine kinase n=2 Tax=Paenibacillus mucilaginosus TaxID=61624 RepID=H6NA01_9BACL|nr:ATP-binding protein [Paenibacillus mucilaginosus]AEI39854.1 PAS/PAC sensor signal transduction histidine kinase [Paenibacillus mucilaginosus KNP414]AFC28529.1 PAS/PAC sensor signal transduction histidine kinase [Paenibacillus mucilaginosus 3016]MCG7217174.1 cell wall metabolism sensor histidine kinase WalK [Paenibacillus mucilaginosus]WDM29132.1 PAS domain S-box protein [Paenibacillus mucilaginosus]WFA17317.1 PAS domain S-box protein [Paenibacillus mucilaginosus]
MKKFRARLTLIFIILIGSSVLTAGIFMARMLQQSYIESLTASMERELRVIKATTDWRQSGSEPELFRFYSDRAAMLRASADARLTFIRSDGKVLGDSDHDPALMENHLEREEIREASASKLYGSAIRYSSTVQRNLLYVAVPLLEGENVTGYLRMAMSLEDVEGSIRQVWFVLTGMLLAVFVIAGLISYRVAYSVTRPIELITSVARQITDMNYKYRVQVNKRDEIGQLGHAINRMADSLELQMNRISEDENRLKSVLESMTSGVIMIDREGKIALLNRSAEEILGFSAKELLGKSFNQAKQQYEFTQLIQECIDVRDHIRDEVIFYYPKERILEINLNPIAEAGGEWEGLLIVLHDITAVRRLERMRSEFVANVSHELKTPIAAVKGFAETLLAGALNDKETARSFLQIIFDESERLNRLIGDILELSKIESKRIPLQFSPVHLEPFIGNCVHVMNTEAKKKGIELELNVDGDFYMEADEDRLRQILINLLSNGISYTPEGGRVRLKVEQLVSGKEVTEHDKVRFTIADTGIGIPKKDLPRIFERFYRVDKARSRSSGGTGLGLSIVKHLVELHKGTIRVESEVGVGTKFIIEMPLIHN